MSSESDDDLPLASKRKAPAKSKSAAAKKSTAAAKRKTLAQSKSSTSSAASKKKSTSTKSSRPASPKKASAKSAVIKFAKPGQKRETPPELDSLRLFYESLYTEKSAESEMAEKWCIQHGVLSEDVAAKIVARMTKDGQGHSAVFAKRIEREAESRDVVEHEIDDALKEQEKSEIKGKRDTKAKLKKEPAAKKEPAVSNESGAKRAAAADWDDEDEKPLTKRVKREPDVKKENDRSVKQERADSDGEDEDDNPSLAAQVKSGELLVTRMEVTVREANAMGGMNVVSTLVKSEPSHDSDDDDLPLSARHQ